jgi:hypothetical protein
MNAVVQLAGNLAIKLVMKPMSAIFIPIVMVGVVFFVGVEGALLEPLDPLVRLLLN